MIRSSQWPEDDYLTKLGNNCIWNVIYSRTKHFCLHVGVPSVSNDPLENITRLREHLIQGARSREDQLQAEVERLGKLCRSQQRIITNLSFRHVLESLPGPKPPPTKGKRIISNTDQWQNFSKTALEKEQKPDTASSPSAPSEVHPLTPLLKKWGKKHIKEGGDGLYARLSENIHDFSGEFTILDDEWDAVEGAILHAPTPSKARKADGEIDWQREKSRFWG